MESGFYCPIAIDWWRYYLAKGCPNKGRAEQYHSLLLSDFGYSLQYLEFLDYQLREVPLHGVVWILTKKSFIITTMSVIEGIGQYLLAINDRGKLKEWEVLEIWYSNHKKSDRGVTRIRSIMEKKLDTPFPDEMNLETIINKLKSSKLVPLSSKDYKALSDFRILRNKIHLYDAHFVRTDWQLSSEYDQQKCKKLLGSFLKSGFFHPTNDDLRMLAWLE